MASRPAGRRTARSPRDVAAAIHARTRRHPAPRRGAPRAVAVTVGSARDAGGRRRRPMCRTRSRTALVARAERTVAARDAVARAGAVIGRSFDLDLLAAVARASRSPDAGRPRSPSSATTSSCSRRGRPAGSASATRSSATRSTTASRLPERRRLHGRTARRRGAAGRTSARDAVPGPATTSAPVARAEAYRGALAGARAATRDVVPPRGPRRCTSAPCGPRRPTCRRRDAGGAPRGARADAAAATDDNEAADGRYEAGPDGLRWRRPTRSRRPRVVAPLVAVRHLLGDDLDDAGRAGCTPALAELDGRTCADRADGAARRPDRGPRLLAGARRPPTCSTAGSTTAIAYATEARDAGRGRPATPPPSATPRRRSAPATSSPAGWTRAGRCSRRSSRRARPAHLEAEAARAYRMLGIVRLRPRRVRRAPSAGCARASTTPRRVELWNHRHYMAAHLAHVLWATGRWAEADDVARHALADGRGGITTRITALHVLGYVALGPRRLAEAPGPRSTRRASSGPRMRELQRLSPALWGLAEVALAARRSRRRPSRSSTRRLRASAAVAGRRLPLPVRWSPGRGPTCLGEAIRGRAAAGSERVGAPIDAPGHPGHAARARPRARPRRAWPRARPAQRADRTSQAAVAGWTRSDRAWEGAWARLDLARCHQRANQRRRGGPARRRPPRARGERLGSPVLVAAADELLASSGARRSAPTPTPWAPLTAREFEVARLVAEGRTNAGDRRRARHLARRPCRPTSSTSWPSSAMGRRAEIAAWVASTARATLPASRRRPRGVASGTGPERARDGASRADPDAKVAREP